MNYLIQASDFDANSLLRTAQGHFDMVRQNPFLRAELLQQGFLEFELESGLMLRLTIEETFVMNVVVTEPKNGMINVSLPFITQWDDIESRPPMWVNAVINGFFRSGKLSRFSRFWDGEVLLKELATLTGKSTVDLANEVLKAKQATDDFAQQLMAMSVDMSEPKAEDWIVDIRGFMLATVIGHYKQ